MAKIKQAFSAKYQTTKDGDVLEAQFATGDAVTLVQTWEHHYLIKDKNGHYYNLKKEFIEP